MLLRATERSIHVLFYLSRNVRLAGDGKSRGREGGGEMGSKDSSHEFKGDGHVEYLKVYKCGTTVHRPCFACKSHVW